jgi:hypothetical protein
MLFQNLRFCKPLPLLHKAKVFAKEKSELRSGFFLFTQFAAGVVGFNSIF